MFDMLYLTLTSNKHIRNLIIVVDIILTMTLSFVIEEFEVGYVEVPELYCVAVLCSLLLAEARFHTVLHHHYQSVDKVFARATWLCFSFSLILSAVCMTYKWMTHNQICDRHAVLFLTVYVFGGILVSRVLESISIKFLRSLGRNTRSICFVGQVDRIRQIYDDINDNATTGLRCIGYFAPEGFADLTSKMPYLGNYSVLEDISHSDVRIADEMYCALKTKDKDLSRQLISYCMKHVVHFYYVPTFISDYGEYLKPTIIGEQVVFANFSEPLLDPTNRMIKRLFDIVCSGIALLCLLPFLPIIILCIEIQSPGNPFFGQARTGRDGKDFKMWKFRSMHINKESDTKQATKDDPRKYPFGSFMRKTSIDELPQLWNIFIGDMSLVGPRPHMRKHTDEYSALIDNYMVRHYIRPGLTGWAQTSGFRGETSELWQMEGRVKRDVWYIQNWSFWLDIRIIMRTIVQSFSKNEQAY